MHILSHGFEMVRILWVTYLDMLVYQLQISWMTSHQWFWRNQSHTTSPGYIQVQSQFM